MFYFTPFSVKNKNQTKEDELKKKNAKRKKLNKTEEKNKLKLKDSHLGKGQQIIK